MRMVNSMRNLPKQFCWTRFGTEASQSIEQILSRKEQERCANGGTFFWGIGNAVGPSMKELIRLNEEPEVLFSPIKGKPKAVDVTPSAIVAWTAARGIFGEQFELPSRSLITSRFDLSNPKTTHYALVCHSDTPLAIRQSATLCSSALRNLLTGRGVGASQVTAIVDRKAPSAAELSPYAVALRTRLVWPYLVKLSAPVLLPPQSHASYGEVDWVEIVERYQQMRPAATTAQQLALHLSHR